MVSYPRRGEIYWANVEHGGKRPVIVVQNDVGNQHSATTIVVPVTSSPAKAWYRVNVRLPEGTLSKPSVAKCSQVRTIDKNRLAGAPIACLHGEMLARIDEALLVSLGLY